MTFQEYIKNCTVTAPESYEGIMDRISNPICGALLAACLAEAEQHARGMTSVKKVIIYNNKKLIDQEVQRDDMVEIIRQVHSPEEGRDRVNLAKIIHALTGIQTEHGELIELLLWRAKRIEPDEKIELDRWVDELGDMMWYIAILFDALNLDPEVVMQANIAKLKKRYGDKFTEAKANDREGYKP